MGFLIFIMSCRIFKLIQICEHCLCLNIVEYDNCIFYLYKIKFIQERKQQLEVIKRKQMPLRVVINQVSLLKFLCFVGCRNRFIKFEFILASCRTNYRNVAIKKKPNKDIHSGMY